MIRTIVGFIQKELRQSLRDPRMRLFIFVVPVVQLIVLGLAISTEVKNIRLAVFAPPSDTVTVRLAQRCFSSGWFIPAGEAGSDPFRKVQSGEADAALIAPPRGLTRALERGEGRLQLLVNARNVVKARSIEGYVQALLQRVVAEQRSGTARPLPLSLDIRILYNPEMKTAIFMVPGVLSMALCLLTVMLTSMSLSKEKELGTFETLLASPAGPGEILLGKSVPYVLLAMIDVPLILAVAVWGFGVPMRGSVLVLMLSAFVFFCTTVSCGVLISTIARNQQQAMMGSFMFIFPALMLSGLFFPVENMPPLLRGIAYADPLWYFLGLIRNIMLKGGDPGVVGFNLGVLSVMAVLAVWASVWRFRRTLD